MKPEEKAGLKKNEKNKTIINLFPLGSFERNYDSHMLILSVFVNASSKCNAV